MQPSSSSSRGDTACVLKGADGKPLADAHGQVRRIDLPGVGRNLQDRYEVTVISKMKRDFSLLEGGTFRLPDGTEPPDPFMKEWRAEGTGLYTSNGSVLGILKRSRPDLAQPDLFMFGLPLPFRGYEIDYSKVGDQHDKFTWAILKGHTRNGDGTVGLRSTDPLDPPLVNFHYFNECSRPNESANDPGPGGAGRRRQVRARHREARERMAAGSRGDLRTASRTRARPGRHGRGSEARMKDWIRRDAWGHHACGTCRMGPAKDAQAVLDSHFRVRRCRGPARRGRVDLPENSRLLHRHQRLHGEREGGRRHCRGQGPPHELRDVSARSARDGSGRGRCAPETGEPRSAGGPRSERDPPRTCRRRW